MVPIVGLDGTIKGSRVIFGGELNFIVSAREIWGEMQGCIPWDLFLLTYSEIMV